MPERLEQEELSLWFDPTQCLVGGTWQSALAGQTLEVRNPSNGQLLCNIAAGQGEDVDAAVAAAQRP